LFNKITSVSKTKYKFLVSEMGEIFHDMPKDWTVADRHQGLGNIVGKVAYAQTQTAAEQHYLHAKHSEQDRCCASALVKAVPVNGGLKSFAQHGTRLPPKVFGRQSDI
jgi:hypothetical protein